MTDELSVPLRLAGFLLIAVVVFAAAWGLGRAVGPIDTEVEEHGGEHSSLVAPTTTFEEGATR